MTNTCPNTLPYLLDGHSWSEYASYFVTIFKYVSEKNFDTRPIPLIMDIVMVYPAHYRTTVGQWLDTLVPRRYIGTGLQLHGKHGFRNLTLVDFYMKSLVYAEGIGRASKFFSETYLNIVTK
uniref:SFRICE_039782 n=1 Tax=Spodoptera frugiperda TaxID=7108 RepID=A0A2H1VL58_SPOFR